MRRTRPSLVIMPLLALALVGGCALPADVVDLNAAPPPALAGATEPRFAPVDEILAPARAEPRLDEAGVARLQARIAVLRARARAEGGPGLTEAERAELGRAEARLARLEG